MTPTNNEVDVLIVGAGPVGLVLAYQLTRLNLSVHIIDAVDKSHPDFPMYGRACTLHSRTLEMLDQLELFDDLAQIGVVGNRNFTYKDGKKVQGRGWTIFEKLAGKTFFDYSLNIRLKYSEDVFRAKLAELGVTIHAPVKLETFSLDEGTADDYKVRATCVGIDGGKTEVRAKYIVGSDGGGSTVRKIAGIPFNGERHMDHWVRIDGVVKTNVPESRIGFGAFESSTHGHVLWVALDNNVTRIGYVLSPELYEKYGTKMSAEDAAREAVKAIAPFELEFEEVQWHTVYGIQQHVAERFQERERILIAGDAAHTHSSGSAQGMNTGMHEFSSLYWRLAGVLRGWYKPEVLALYSDERRVAAQQLIENDQLISALISRKLPARFKDRTEDPMVLLDEVLRGQTGFTLGLGISYAPNMINDVEGSYPPVTVAPGHRAPDVLVRKPGMSRVPVRLYEVTKYNGKFRLLVFTGSVHETRVALQSLRKQVDQHASRFAHAVDFLTLIAGTGIVIDEHLGVRRFGKAYWDTDNSAHLHYGVHIEQGALVVLRPDGLLGFVAPLDGFESVARYFERIVVAAKTQPNGKANGHATRKELGEFITPDETNLAMPVEDGDNKEAGLVGA
ncbi:hypothetical protein LTR85_007328 [Meristemomyces frigidus]|nr:hypothetical protein LTR85_007328 [Meristemomyces frigidus]